MTNWTNGTFFGFVAAHGPGLLVGGRLLTDLENCLATEDELPDLPALAGGKRVADVEFVGERRIGVGNVTGTGLNGRLALDLAKLRPDSLVTPNARHFIRTRVPDGLDYSRRDPWTVRIDGLVDDPIEIPVQDIRRKSKPMGTHVLECSGNSSGRAFGLLSAARWDGVPVSTILERVSGAAGATGVMISGFDDHSVEPGRGIEQSSSRGASWVFTFDDLKNTGAFLATKMNGKALPVDHGYPVRLFVPGWYGCTCAKWVDHIRLVGDDFPATSQMREFASRTHQSKAHRLARDYRPAEMDLAAMPIRVEQWDVNGKPVYRVVGILWGGNTTTDKLMIRLGSRTAPVTVESYSHRQNSTWTLWQHVWQPSKAGRYRISITVDDENIRTRRLDRGYYARRVRIKAI